MAVRPTQGESAQVTPPDTILAALATEQERLRAGGFEVDNLFLDLGAAAALLSTDDLVTVSSGAGVLSRFDVNGTNPWQVGVTSPSSLVVTASGDIVLGEVSGELPSLCAHDASSGGPSWCTTLPDAVLDLLVGDDGVIYVAVANQPGVYGYDAATGALRYTFDNVGYPVEMLLRGGRSSPRRRRGRSCRSACRRTTTPRRAGRCSTTTTSERTGRSRRWMIDSGGAGYRATNEAGTRGASARASVLPTSTWAAKYVPVSEAGRMS